MKTWNDYKEYVKSVADKWRKLKKYPSLSEL